MFDDIPSRHRQTIISALYAAIETYKKCEKECFDSENAGIALLGFQFRSQIDEAMSLAKILEE
jgi:hypothetical protein